MGGMKIDAQTILEALRVCGDIRKCEHCPIQKPDERTCIDTLLLAAADEIAALRAERKEMTLRVNDALQYLDAINEQGEIEYSDYSALYDNIVKIDTTAEAAHAALEGGQANDADWNFPKS